MIIDEDFRATLRRVTDSAWAVTGRSKPVKEHHDLFIRERAALHSRHSVESLQGAVDRWLEQSYAKARREPSSLSFTN